jgi:hypothetical protein
MTSSGEGCRGPSKLCADALWDSALSLLRGAREIAVISGFYVPSVLSPETDGPPGALVLARALSRAGKDVRTWTDSLCLGAFKACADVLGIQRDTVEDASAPGFDPGETPLLVYVERLGRAADGGYYNMRGEDISQWTAPLDSFASLGARSIGIGDGGNEVGMGNFNSQLRELMPGYGECLCVVKADVCLPVDVSNWGAYALAAAMSAVYGRWLGQSLEEEASMLRALAAAGAVDGITKRNEASVDGFGLERQLEVVSLLKAAAGF